MLNEVIRGVLAILIAAGLKIVLVAIGVEIDEVLFNTLVAGFVGYLMVLLGLEGVNAGIRKFKSFRRG